MERLARIGLLGLALSLLGQWLAAGADSKQATSEVETALKGLKWRPIGPANMGGRVTDIVGIPGEPSTYYVAGADGGVFKTTNAGTTFEALFTDQRAFSVGALALAPSDRNVLWLGSGEGDPRNSVGYGNGVYRSLDGGKTWAHLGLDDSERIKRIVVHPRDPDTAFVCAMGHSWGPNPERGVFRTTDGGRNWDKILYQDQDTGCSDLAMESGNPRVLYAGMWTFRRRPWRFDDGGGKTALYRSIDGGESWKKLEKGLPKGPLARIGVAVSASHPNIVYAITESPKEGTLFRSDDRGESWRKASDDRRINFRPFYYSDIRVDPNNPDHVYSLSGGLYKSTDGGKKFDRIARGVHGDHQALWIDPEDSKRVLSGSDGGYQVSFDSGKTWDIVNNVVLSQFYQIFVDDSQPYNVCGGLQDNGTWCGPSRSTHTAGILKRDWFKLTGGDGYYAVPVPGRPHQFYTNLQGGVIFFTDVKQNLTRTIHPYPKITGSAGDAIAQHRYRFNWDSPIHISPHDPNKVYFGGNVLFSSTDQGNSWREISSDLTSNDKSKQQTSGGEIYQDNTAAEFHCTILTIAESPLEAGVIWVGTDDGNVQITRDGGRNWTNVKDNLPGLPSHSWIAKIDASRHRKGSALVAVDNHRSDIFKPFAYRTDDYGQTWTALHGGLPQDDYVKVIREDLRNPSLVYAGMEHGIYASWNGGQSWTSIRNNLPPVSVRDIKIQDREQDLVIGTHGRGVWILDDIRPLQDLARALSEDVHVFPVRPATRWQLRNKTANLGQREYRADNPAYGAFIHFYLKTVPEHSEEEKEADAAGALLKILDGDGRTVREIEIKKVEPGINRAVWNLRREGLGERRPGPRVAPGLYKAVLSRQDREWTTAVEVKPDPRLPFSMADYRAQAEATASLWELARDINDLVKRMGEIERQMKNLRKSLGSFSENPGNRLPKSVDIKAALSAIGSAEEAFRSFSNESLKRPLDGLGYRQRPRLQEEIRSLLFAIDRSAGRPTQPQSARVGELERETRDVKREYERLYSAHIGRLNRSLKDLPAIVIGGSSGR